MGKRIHGILLAAGFSQRFKGNKLLYLLKGKALYLHLTERLEILLKKGYWTVWYWLHSMMKFFRK